MPSNPCHLPPGREWNIRNCLAIIPRPQWAKYQKRGRFNPGIQKGLDETAACHVNEAVVVDGQVIDLTNNPIPGVFPPGWYRHCEQTQTEPEPVEDPIPPAEREPVPLDVVLERPELVGTTQRLDMSCKITYVQSVDVSVPWPLRPTYISGTRYDVGELGWATLRIPGADDDSLFRTGWGYIFNGGWEHGTAWKPRKWRFIPWCIAFSADTVNQLTIPHYGSPYYRTHMQCLPKNVCPPRPRHHDGYWFYEEMGFAGAPRPVAWVRPGMQPHANPVEASSTGCDQYAEQHASRDGKWFPFAFESGAPMPWPIFPHDFTGELDHLGLPERWTQRRLRELGVLDIDARYYQHVDEYLGGNWPLPPPGTYAVGGQ